MGWLDKADTVTCTNTNKMELIQNPTGQVLSLLISGVLGWVRRVYQDLLLSKDF